MFGQGVRYCFIVTSICTSNRAVFSNFSDKYSAASFSLPQWNSRAVVRRLAIGRVFHGYCKRSSYPVNFTHYNKCPKSIKLSFVIMVKQVQLSNFCKVFVAKIICYKIVCYVDWILFNIWNLFINSFL